MALPWCPVCGQVPQSAFSGAGMNLNPFQLQFLTAAVLAAAPSRFAEAASATINYQYDAPGRLAGWSIPGQGAVTFGYDPNGNLLQQLFSAETDADHDGLVAAQEVALGLDPNNPDTDHDGSSDGGEVIAGTNPLDPQSLFQITSSGKTPAGAVEITVPSVPGRHYFLQSSADLLTWSNDDGTGTAGTAGTGAPLTLRDPNPEIGRKFYRVTVSY